MYNSEVSVSGFAQRYDLSEETVKEKIRNGKIPGATCKEEKYHIPDSARYPYNLRNTKINDYIEKAYVLLKATSENYYVDADSLRMPVASFNCLIRELTECGLLQTNGAIDENGVNAYDITLKAGEMMKNRRKKKVLEGIKALIECIGAGAGAFFNQMDL